MLRLLLAAACGLACTSAPAAGKLAVGFAEVDVSPVIGPKPVYLAGFGDNRKATRIHDPIMARAVVLAEGPEKIAFVSVDVVGLFHGSAENVRKQLPGFQYVLVSSTHNHEGPDTLGLWGPNPFQTGVDSAYLKSVEDGAATAVKLAAEKLAPADAFIGTAAGPELLHDARKPVVKLDELVAIRFESAGKLAGILVQWNCHPETLDARNTEVSADFVHYTVTALREKYKCPVAYFTGAVGGLMTSLHVPLKNDRGEDLKDGTFEKTEKYGVKVAELAATAVAAAKPVTLTPFAVRTRATLFPVDNPLYRLAFQVGKVRRTLYEWHDDPTPNVFIETKDATKSVAVKSEVGYLTLGDLDIAVIPGEIYPELVLGQVQTPADPGADFPTAPVEPAIYAPLRGKYRMLVGLANDELGYFIPKRQWDEQKPFCYGATRAPYGEINSVGPDAAPILCRVFRELVEGK